MTNNQIDSKIVELKQFESEMKELEKVIESLKDELKSEMTSRDVDVLETGTFKITWKEVITNRFDSKRFKSENQVIYESYLKSSSSRPFKIS